MRTTTPTLLVVTAVLYAANYPLGALALHDMSPFLLIALRFAVTAVVTWAAVLVLRTALPRGRTWWHAVGAGLLVQGAQFLGAYWAMSHGVGAGVTALVVAMNPVVATVLGGLLDRRREPLLAYGAVALGAVAVVLACAPRIVRDPSLGAGLGAVLVALAGLSLGSVWQGRTLRGVSPVSFTAIGTTVSLPFAAVLATLVPESVHPGARTWVLFAVVTVVGLVGSTMYASSVARVGARSAAMLFAVIPALAALIAWPVVGEPLDAVVGVALVLGAVACAVDVVATRRRAVTSGAGPRRASRPAA